MGVHGVGMSGIDTTTKGYREEGIDNWEVI
jgi:hypothetical protein